MKNISNFFSRSLSSVLCPLTSVFRPLISVLRPLPSVLCLLSSVLCLLPPVSHAQNQTNVFKGNRILGLYDSTEKTTLYQNEIRRFIEPVLLKMGYVLDCHDIASGFPLESSMKKYRAIITWYRDGIMRDAEAYCNWAADQIENNIKFIILGNFGAFQDKTTGQWLSFNVINNVFNSLGLIFRGNWTSDTDTLEILYKDTKMVEYEIPLKLKDVKYYQQIEVLDKNKAKVFLEVNRKDLKKGGSAVVVTTNKGAQILPGYIYWENAQYTKLLFRINLEKFLKISFGTASGNFSETLIVSRQGKQSKKFVKNAVNAFKYAKIKYNIVSFSEFRGASLDELNHFKQIIIGFDISEVFAGFGLLKQYIKQGGNVLFALGGYKQGLKNILGIEKYNGYFQKDFNGLSCVKPFFPGMENMIIKEDVSAISNLSVQKKVDIFFESLQKTKDNKKVPLIWENKFFKGKIIYCNTDMLSSKIFRGFLTQLLLKLKQAGVIGILNAGIIHLDDCPMPMWNLKKSPVKQEFNMTDTEFYLQVWLPFMLNIKKEFGLEYTAYAILNYNGRIHLPFDNSQFYIGKDNASIKMAKKLMENNVEIGLHGYNHQPLVQTTQIFNPWTSRREMIDALKSAKKDWEKFFSKGEVPFSYVAPNNYISPIGEDALHKVFPGIKVISTVYETDSILYDHNKRLTPEALVHEFNSEETAKEFGTDPWNNNFYNIPRFSQGYIFTNKNKYAIINGISNFGLWVHFVHPDDVYDSERNFNKTWKEMEASFRKMLKFVFDEYSWLRPMTNKDAYFEFLFYDSIKMDYKVFDDAIKITSTVGSNKDKYFLVKLNNGKKIKSFVNCSLIKHYEEFDIYVIKTKNAKCSLELM